jgi:hypothetical protein
MPSKRDSLSKRWAAAKKEAKQQRSLVFLADHASEGKNSEAAIRAATTINPENPSDRDIQRLFDDLRLDPTNIHDWRTALVRAASVLSPEPGKPGAPRTWGSDRLGQLLKDYKEFKDRYPRASDIRICERLAQTGKYGNHAQTIRRQLQNAKNPNVNPVLGFYLDQFTIIYRADRFRQGTWSRRKEATYRRKMVPRIIDRIATRGGFLREK